MANLTSTVFAEGVGLLAARWRDVPPQIAAIMGEWLMAKGCTAEEFIAGVKRAIAEDDFLPNARRILELGRVDAPAEARGGEVFARVLDVRRYSPLWGTRLALDDVRAELGEPAMRAVAAVGVSRLEKLTDDAYPFVRKDFIAAFAAFDREQGDRVAAGRFLAGASSSRQIRRGGDPTPVARLVDHISD